MKPRIFIDIETPDATTVRALAAVGPTTVYAGYAASSTKFVPEVSMVGAPVTLCSVTAEIARRTAKALQEAGGDVLALHAAAREIVASYEDMFTIHIVVLEMKVTNEI